MTDLIANFLAGDGHCSHTGAGSSASPALDDSGPKAASTIAYNLGFNDVSHFNRSFRQRFGCTPSDVRSAARSRGDEGEGSR